MTNNIIVKNLSVSFGKENNLLVLKNISTTFKEKKITAIIGESGSGKSILAMSILRLLSNKASLYGKIIYRNKNLLLLSEKEMTNLRGRKLGLIPQNPADSLNPVLKIYKQLYEIIMQKRESDKKIDKFLLRLGFNNPEEIKNKYPFELSGGMQQRIVSLFGIVSEPEWIIADEPTKGLDSILRGQVYDFFSKLKQSKNKSIIIITHDINIAIKLSDYLIVMRNGKIIEEGETKEIYNNPKKKYTKILFDSLPSNLV